MVKYVLAVGAIFILLFGWVAVQVAYRRFAVKYPELGPYRNDMEGCGNCGCGGGKASANSCSSE